MRIIIAQCDRCGGVWRVTEGDDPDLMEGACMDCTEESEVAERPLMFRYLDDLPEGWMI